MSIQRLTTAAGAFLLDPYMPYNFIVEITGLIVGGFTEVSGLESEIQTESYEEGGQNDYVHQFPKGTIYPPLILSKGLTDMRLLWEWYHSAQQGDIQRRSGTILLLDPMRLPAMQWDFKEAYPVKWTGPQLNSNDDTVAVERIELVHRGITVPLSSLALSKQRATAQLAGKGLNLAANAAGRVTRLL